MSVRLLALVLVAFTAARASAEPVVTIRNNGPAANRIDLMILGDGYRSNELVKFSTDTDVLVTGLFSQTPFREYAAYFNVHRVDVVSNESGADHPGVARDTALGANYNCGGIARLICVDIGAVDAVVSRSLPANAREAIMVLVNDSAYGGSGGRVAVASTHRDVVELMLHEFGHSLGLLADEYVDNPPPPSCATGSEPSQVNATRATMRETIKWGGWVAAGTPVPTTTTTAAVPGLYEGAHFCPSGVFRPTYNSKMRSLGRAFEQINSEQLILRFYNFVSPIDSVSPADTTLTTTAGDRAAFQAQTPRPDGHALSFVWRLNGAQVGTASTLTLDTAPLAVRTNTLELEVTDPTGAVRRRREALQQRHTWTLIVDHPLLVAGQSIRSANGRYRLLYQTDGNLVLYDDQLSSALWGTNTGNGAPGQVVMQDDGNLVVYDRAGAALWTSGTGGNAGAYMVVQDDGKFVICRSDGQPIWDQNGN